MAKKYLKFIAKGGLPKAYNGRDDYSINPVDGNPEPVSLRDGDLCAVSAEKAAQMLEDYPDNFTEVKEADYKKYKAAKADVPSSVEGAPDKAASGVKTK